MKYRAGRSPAARLPFPEWIVNLALRRPYTFIVLAIFILIAGVLSIVSIPVISVIWTFTGMAPEEVEQHITSPYERVLTTTVDNIEHIESQSLNGIAENHDCGETRRDHGFIPIFFLSGVAKYLFSPLAEAVIFAMIASYILSRTLVPTLAMYWMSKHGEKSHQAEGRKTFAPFTWFSRFHRWFNNRFEKFREGSSNDLFRSNDEHFVYHQSYRKWRPSWPDPQRGRAA